MPGPFETVLLLAFLLVPLAIVVLFAMLIARRNRAATGGFPITQPDGPGNYKIVGVDSATRQDKQLTLQAESRANAQVKAELDGIVVTAVSKVT